MRRKQLAESDEGKRMVKSKEEKAVGEKRRGESNWRKAKSGN
jgi:hypothetical protein